MRELGLEEICQSISDFVSKANQRIDIFQIKAIKTLADHLQEEANRSSSNITLRSAVDDLLKYNKHNCDLTSIENGCWAHAFSITNLSNVPSLESNELQALFYIQFLRVIVNYVSQEDSNSNREFVITSDPEMIEEMTTFIDKRAPSLQEDESLQRLIRMIFIFLNNLSLSADEKVINLLQKVHSKFTNKSLISVLVSYLGLLDVNISTSTDVTVELSILDSIGHFPSSNSGIITSNDVHTLLGIFKQMQVFGDNYDHEKYDEDDILEIQENFEILASFLYNLSAIEDLKNDISEISFNEAVARIVQDYIDERPIGLPMSEKEELILQKLTDACLNFSLNPNNNNDQNLHKNINKLLQESSQGNSQKDKLLAYCALTMISIGNFIGSKAQREEICRMLSRDSENYMLDLWRLLQSIFNTMYHFHTVEKDLLPWWRLNIQFYRSIYLMNKLIDSRESLQLFFQDPSISGIYNDALLIRETQEELMSQSNAELKKKFQSVYALIVKFWTRLMQGIVLAQESKYLAMVLDCGSTHFENFDYLFKLYLDNSQNTDIQGEIEIMLYYTIQGIILLGNKDDTTQQETLQKLVNAVFLMEKKPANGALAGSETQIPLPFISEKIKTLGLLLSLKSTEDIQSRLKTSELVTLIVKEAIDAVEVLKPQREAVGIAYDTIVNNLRFVSGILADSNHDEVLHKFFVSLGM